MISPRPTTILVVDDNAANLALARATLEDEGHRVVVADGGEAGVAAFAAESPDCVLLDVRMPDVDGPTACRRIRALPGGADVAIIFVTALRDLETFDRAQLAGGDDYLTKPYRPTELLARVAVALKLRRLAAERSELYAEMKQRRDDLVRLQLQNERLIGFVVHDLKNPVNTIGLLAELLIRDHDGSERSRSAGERIRGETRTLSRMIVTLLDLAKADAGRLEPVRSHVELAAVIKAVLEGFAARARRATVELVAEVTQPTLRADHDLLRRVLDNLVDNAIRHAPAGTAVRVSAHPRDGGVELRVRDGGPGVPPDQRARVFDRFAQTGGYASDDNRGLGLAFCKVAVEAHGGRIWIEDANPGAAFCLWMGADA